jgi:hypothetical protein
MNLKKYDAAAIATLVVLMAASHIFANQVFATPIGNIINAIVTGPCVQENGKFMYNLCAKFDPSLLNNGTALKNLLLSNKPLLKNLLLNDKTVVKSLLMNNTTASK